LNDVEAGAYGALSEYFCSFGHLCPKHMIFDVVEFAIGEVVEDEMIFEAGEDEGFICF
jgi:hypothetical protein